MAVPETNKVMLVGRKALGIRGTETPGEGADQRLRRCGQHLFDQLPSIPALIALSLYDNEETGAIWNATHVPDSSFARRGFSSLSRAFSRSEPDRVRRSHEAFNGKSGSPTPNCGRPGNEKNRSTSLSTISAKESKAWIREAARE